MIMEVYGHNAEVNYTAGFYENREERILENGQDELSLLRIKSLDELT